MHRRLSLALLACLACACAAQSAAVRTDDTHARSEAADLAREIAEAETTLAAHLEAPRCDEACVIADRICALSARICALAERDPDDELASRCSRSTASCDSAGERVSAACPDCAGPAPR